MDQLPWRVDILLAQVRTRFVQRAAAMLCYLSIGITFVVVVVISSGAHIHYERSGILPTVTLSIIIAISTRCFRSICTDL